MLPSLPLPFSKSSNSTTGWLFNILQFHNNNCAFNNTFLPSLHTWAFYGTSNGATPLPIAATACTLASGQLLPVWVRQGTQERPVFSGTNSLLLEVPIQGWGLGSDASTTLTFLRMVSGLDLIYWYLYMPIVSLWLASLLLSQVFVVILLLIFF